MNNEQIAVVDNGITSVELLDKISEGNLALFSKAVGVISEMTNKNPKFIAETIMKGQALGLKPYAAYSAFWDMTEAGAGAEIKTGALMGYLVSKSQEKGGFIKPFEVLQDASYTYYYYDGGIEGLNEVYKEYNNYLNKSKEKIPLTKDGKPNIISFETFAVRLLTANLYAESNPNNPKEIKTGFKVQVGTGRYAPKARPEEPDKELKIFERVTTLKGYRKYPNGIEDLRVHNYYLSTAIKIGLYYDKNGNIKKMWNNLSNMMLKRCTSELCNIIAPDIVYPFENSLDEVTNWRAEQEEKELSSTS